MSQKCFTQNALLLQSVVIQQSLSIALDAILSNCTKHTQEGEGHVPSTVLLDVLIHERCHHSTCSLAKLNPLSCSQPLIACSAQTELGEEL